MPNIIVEVDASTGEVVERAMTSEEQAQYDADIAAIAAQAAAHAERQAAAESARRKIAEASGLTPEEMTALGF